MKRWTQHHRFSVPFNLWNRFTVASERLIRLPSFVYDREMQQYENET